MRRIGLRGRRLIFLQRDRDVTHKRRHQRRGIISRETTPVVVTILPRLVVPVVAVPVADAVEVLADPVAVVLAAIEEVADPAAAGEDAVAEANQRECAHQLVLCTKCQRVADRVPV
jgi:hypothetical protein